MIPARRVLSAVLLVAALAACSSNPAGTARASAKASVDTGGPGAGVTAPPNVSLPAGVGQVQVPGDVDPWALSALDYDGQSGTRYGYWCPPGGTPRTIWGTDLYTHDSSVCTAGVHAGAITLQTGGFVVIEMRAGADSYAGTARNGIDSQPYGPWGGSYVIVRF
ncbi:MAG: hypothetical protein QOH61_2484 [Chloroflexota bacterium]|nr:hypothetical protein [Chloroflexota bacterium]